MSIKIHRLTRALGAVVEGVSLSEPLTAELQAQLAEWLLDHQVLFFRGQDLEPQVQAQLAAHFGALHIHPIYPVLPDLPEIMVIDNHLEFLPDNDTWHTDVTFSETPPLAGILAAKRIPPVGGDTLWSSNSAAYEGLSPGLQRYLDGLTATHSVVKSFPPQRWQNDPAFKARYERAVAKHPPVVHPVVRTHPVTGRKGLFVSEGFTTHINDIPVRESEWLLGFLVQHAARPEFTVRWHWSEGDVAFWDNRITQHYAVADYLPERRTMHRATVIGDRPFH